MIKEITHRRRRPNDVRHSALAGSRCVRSRLRTGPEQTARRASERRARASRRSQRDRAGRRRRRAAPPDDRPARDRRSTTALRQAARNVADSGRNASAPTRSSRGNLRTAACNGSRCATARRRWPRSANTGKSSSISKRSRMRTRAAAARTSTAPRRGRVVSASARPALKLTSLARVQRSGVLRSCPNDDTSGRRLRETAYSWRPSALKCGPSHLPYGR